MTDQPPYRVAVIVTVYNEATFLPIWLTYYGLNFGLANLFVIDDGSTDGSTDNLGPVNVIKIEQAEIDQDRRARDVSFFHNELLKHYDAAIYTDVDELLVVDPMLGLGLRDYIRRTRLDHFNALGLNVMQDPEGEADYSSEAGLFEQRKFVQFERGYCKQLIHKKPVFWGVGFHVSTAPVAMAAALYLFHLRTLDIATSISRINGRNKLAWSQRSLSKNLGWHNRLAEQDYLNKYYVFDQARFAAAEPASRFNAMMVAIAGRVQSDPTAFDGRFADLERPILTLPDRFRASVAAVTSIALIEAMTADNVPPAPPGMDAQEVYLRAVKKAEEVVDLDG